MGKGVFEQLIDFDLPLVAIDPDKIGDLCRHKWSESTSIHVQHTGTNVAVD
tara:strand:+ start:246 stop:398 length:153 start_codon:yes stop_codon:yes gene_type:complete